MLLFKIIRQVQTLDNPQALRVVNDPNAPKPMRICDVCGCFLIIGFLLTYYLQHIGFIIFKFESMACRNVIMSMQ